MKRFFLKLLANIVFVVHCVIVLTVLFGWLIPQIWWGYMIILAGTLLLDIVLGYCILSRFEFNLRKKLNPRLNYENSFSSYYTYKLTRTRISEKFIEIIGLIFLTSSLVINVYIHFFVK